MFFCFCLFHMSCVLPDKDNRLFTPQLCWKYVTYMSRMKTTVTMKLHVIISIGKLATNSICSFSRSLSLYISNYLKQTSYLIAHFPRLVANMTMGAIVDSKARWRYVKHSISNMWTSSMKRTPGTNSAMPWSMYLLTTLLISFLSLSEVQGWILKTK